MPARLGLGLRRRRVIGSCRGVRGYAGGVLEGGGLYEVPRILVLCERRFDFATQGLIAGAGFLKHCCPAALLGVEGLVKNALDFPSAVRFHLSCYSFRVKPGFASLQSRATVSGNHLEAGEGQPSPEHYHNLGRFFLAPPDVLFEIISGSVTGFGGSCGQIWTNKSKNIASMYKP